jgi:hypothetical protein
MPIIEPLLNGKRALEPLTVVFFIPSKTLFSAAFSWFPASSRNTATTAMAGGTAAESGAAL